MWTCRCGCQNIAAGVPSCPVCGEENSMGKITSAGPSSGPAEPEPVVEPEPEPTPAPKKSTKAKSE